MYCISYNLYKYIQRLSLLIFCKKGSGGSCYTGARWREAGWEIKGDGVKVFVCFCDVCVWKNGSLYTNGAPYHVDQLGGQLQCGGSGLGRKCSFSPWLEEKKNLSPGDQCATVESSLQSIHVAEVHFYFIKIRYNWWQRSLKPAILAPWVGGETGELRSGWGAVYCLVGCGSRSAEVPKGVVVARPRVHGWCSTGTSNPWLWPYWKGGVGRMGGSRKGALVWGWSACGWSVRREEKTTCGGTGRPGWRSCSCPSGSWRSRPCCLETFCSSWTCWTSSCSWSGCLPSSWSEVG